MTNEEKVEYEKCKNDPWYFYNKYVVVKGAKKLTEKEFKNKWY